ncbi:hypothetical protein [Actinopolyspora mortivallis]|uniref:hypothetical protein n=1 Tax=Actinopolyspora mortivallis TaxID=33906 RepID=UPI0011B1D67F|nr:hypothetical protein [Actinopolyspora mortivallis]
MEDQSEQSRRSANGWIPARTQSTSNPVSADPGGTGPSSPSPTTSTLTDTSYRLLLLGLTRDITTISITESVVVCGVVRTSENRCLVCVSLGGDITRRYALTFPLILEEGNIFDHVTALKAIRLAESCRLSDFENFEKNRTGIHFHGADTYSGKDFAKKAHEQEHLLQDALRSSMTELLSSQYFREPDTPPERDAETVGFSCFAREKFRVYLTTNHPDRTIGIDLPLTFSDEKIRLTPSASLHGELNALLRTGKLDNIQQYEIASDQFCSRLYDLRSWF